MSHEAHSNNCRPDETKLCTGCGHSRPLSDFRRKRKNDERRQTRCRDCHRRYMAAFRRSRKHRELQKFARQIKWRSNVDFLEAASRAIVDRYGGLRQFALSYCEFFRKMASDPRSSQAAVDGYVALIRLLEVVAKEQQAAGTDVESSPVKVASSMSTDD